MSRPLRIEYPGAVYHITSRGNAKQPIFLTVFDRLAFLEILSDITSRYNWLCHSYCLMNNHYHLLVETIDPTLARGMRQLNGIYAQKFNYYHDRVGHIFQGRYKSILVEKGEHLLELCRYLVLNPVRANLVSHPEKWAWSSYQAIACNQNVPVFLTTDWVLSQFGDLKDVARNRYREFVAKGMKEPSEPWDKIVGQLIFGGHKFVADIQQKICQQQKIVEISKKQKFVDRPGLEEIFSTDKATEKCFRNRLIVKAHLEHGYMLKEIADQLDIHYSTVSKVISKAKK